MTNTVASISQHDPDYSADGTMLVFSRHLRGLSLPPPAFSLLTMRWIPERSRTSDT